MEDPSTPPHREAALVDRRVIGFRARAICDALNALWQANGHGVQAVGIDLLPADQAVVVTTQSAGGLSARRLERHELTTALIRYCGGARVPLPAAAAKNVTVTADGVLLDLTLALKAAPAFRTTRLPRR